MKKHISIFIDGKKFQFSLNKYLLFLVGRSNLLVSFLFVFSLLSLLAYNVLGYYVDYKCNELYALNMQVDKLESKSNVIFDYVEQSKRITKISSNLLDVNSFGLGDYGIGGGALSSDISKVEHLDIKFGVFDNLIDNIIYSKNLNSARKIALVDDLSSRPSIKPTEGFFASRFGYRVHPILNTRKFHEGLDIAYQRGTPIHASASGVVLESSYSTSFGNVAKILHKTSNDEYVTVYAHMDEVLINKGDKIEKGELIGKMGSTGRSTGTHLHYEVIKNGEHVNPMKYIYPEDNIID